MRVWLFMLVVLCVVICSANTACGMEVVWVRYSDKSLWITHNLSSSDARLLYGHDVQAWGLTPSPNGMYVAAGGIFDQPVLFDTQSPGHRLPPIKLDPYTEEFLGEWTADGASLFIQRYVVNQQNQDGLYLGLYSASPGGKRKLIAKPPREGLLPPLFARRSPNGKWLAIDSGIWLQTIDIRTGRSILFLQDKESATPPTWVNNNCFVFADSDSTWLVDVSKKTVKPWIVGMSASSLSFSQARNKLYARMRPRGSQISMPYVIDPGTGKRTQLKLGSLCEFGEILDISSDGKYMLMVARDPMYGEPGQLKLGTHGIWIVDLDSGEYKLISSDSFAAAFVGQ